jgi:hypothetical protein
MIVEERAMEAEPLPAAPVEVEEADTFDEPEPPGLFHAFAEARSEAGAPSPGAPGASGEARAADGADGAARVLGKRAAPKTGGLTKFLKKR